MVFQRGNKKILFASGLILAALLIALFWYFSSHHPRSTASDLPSPPISWKIFEGTNPPFDFTFEYPAYWKTKEVMLTGALNMAQILGPQDKATKVIPAIYFKIQEAKSNVLPSKFSEALLQKESRFKGFKKLHEDPIIIAGVNGLRLAYQYILPLPMRSMDAQDTVMRREEVLLEHGGKSYQISFWATGEQFKTDQVVFEHALKTFKFK